MKLFRIAYNNVRNSLSIYRLYLLSLIFTVMLFYQFINLRNHPVILSIDNVGWIADIVNITLIIMMIFIVFFLNFSNTFYLRERKKEIGLYALIGTTPYKIGLIIAIENMIMFLLAITLGIGLGILFSKLFIMIIAGFLNLGLTIEFYMDSEAIILAFLVFSIIGFLLSLKGFIIIRFSKINDLLKGKKKEERIPGSRLIIGIISLLILYFGYRYSITIRMSNFTTNFFGAILFVIIGTFLFYRSVMTEGLKLIMKNKRFVYRKDRLLVLSSLWYRIGTNYKVYAAVTIYITVILTGFATAYSLYYGDDEVNDRRFPFEVQIYTEESFESEISSEVEKVLKSNDLDYTKYEGGKIALVQYEMERYEGVDPDFDDSIYIMSYSEAIKMIKPFDNNATKRFKEITLPDNQVLFVHRPNFFMLTDVADDVTIGNVTYDIKKTITLPLFNQDIGEILIVSDNAYKNCSGNFQQTEHKYVNYKIEDLEGVDLIKSSLLNLSFQEKYNHAAVDVNGAENRGITQLLVIKLFFVLGVFITLSFILATGSIIYFKIISQCHEDIQTYKILSQIGLDNKARKKIITKQLLMFFLIPILFAGLHAYFAVKALELFMGMTLIIPMILTLTAVSLIFMIYYMLTIQKYQKIVLN